MKTPGMVVAVCCIAFVITPARAQKKQANPRADQTVSASGYVTAGVEAGCLMLQDSSTRTLYNLLFSGKQRPALGDQIHFTGTRHDGPTSCMQGQPVDVKKWTPLKTTGGKDQK